MHQVVFHISHGKIGNIEWITDHELLGDTLYIRDPEDSTTKNAYQEALRIDPFNIRIKEKLILLEQRIRQKESEKTKTNPEISRSLERKEENEKNAGIYMNSIQYRGDVFFTIPSGIDW